MVLLDGELEGGKSLAEVSFSLLLSLVFFSFLIMKYYIVRLL